MKTVRVLAGLVLLAVSFSMLAAGDGQFSRRDLDLPYNAFDVADEEDEAPNVFFLSGCGYAADAVIFCLDRSGVTRERALEFEKVEVIRAINQLSSDIEFGIVLYDSGVLRWPAAGQPADASESNKQRAVSWLTSIMSGNGMCVREGMLTALNMANRSSSPDETLVLYIGGGGTFCPGWNAGAYATDFLRSVRRTNFNDLSIHAVDLAEPPSGLLRCVSTESGGTYVSVPTVSVRADARPRGGGD